MTNKKDREIAIHGLAQRMKRIWQTAWAYGVFTCFAARLLLWRRPSENALSGDDENALFGDDVPSWSWMTYSSVEFLPIESLLVPPRSTEFELRDSDKRLLARVRVLKDCEGRAKGRDVDFVGRDGKDVGHCWSDKMEYLTFKHCVVIGMEDSIEERGKSDSEKKYYVLFVLEKGPLNEFERVGVGMITARCVSERYVEGSVV